MKIDKIQQNYVSNARVVKNNSNPNLRASVAFQGKGKNLTDKIIDSLAGGKAIRFMEKLEWLKGEIGGILITAIGTGCVAPIFIGFNPFVKAPKDATPEEKKEVKNTKLYTAMRQPISATLAILFQVAALKPIDKFLDILFNKKDFAKNMNINVDQSVINNDAYVNKLAKAEMKRDGKKVPKFLERYTDRKAYKARKEEFKQELKTIANRIKTEQIDKVAEDFAKTGQIKVGERFIKDSSVAELVNSRIDDYIKDANILKIDQKGLAYYSERAKVLLENEEHLKEIFKNIPEDPKEVTKILEGLLAKEKNPEVKKLIEETLERIPEIRGSHMRRTLSRIDKIKAMCSGHYSFDTYLKAMGARNAVLDKIVTELNLAKIKDVSKATPESIKETVQKIIDICHFENSNQLRNDILHDTSTFSKDAAALTKKVNKDVAKAYKDFVKHNYKSVNQIIKIAIGVLITLPITCNALNWVYPRFMDKFFPQLAGAKKASSKEGGDK